MAQPNERPSVGPAHDEINRLSDLQCRSNSTLDTKAGIVLGFSTTGITMLAGKTDMDGKLVLASAVLLATAAGFAMWILIPKRFRYDPNPQVLLDDYMNRAPLAAGVGAIEQMLADKLSAYKENAKMMGRKATAVSRAIALMAVGLLLGLIPIFRRCLVNDGKPTSAPATQAPSAPAPIAQAPSAPAPAATANPQAMNVYHNSLDSANIQKKGAK